MIDGEQMANDLMGVVEHADYLLDEVHEALKVIKSDFEGAVWAAERWREKHEQISPEEMPLDSGLYETLRR